MSDLGRAVLIDICKDGSVSFRRRNSNDRRLNDAALPVFSVDTVEQARDLQVLFCTRQHEPHPFDGRAWYVLPYFSGNISDLAEVADMFRLWWDARDSRPAARRRAFAQIRAIRDRMLAARLQS